MANSIRGEGRTVYRAYSSYPAHLPPRIPTFPCVGSNLLNSSTSSDKGQMKTSYNGSQRQHQQTPADFSVEEQPSWLEDLLEDPEFPSKKGPHRRSASDSFTFLDAPGSLYTISNIAEEEEFDCNVEAQLCQASSKLYKTNEHQLMPLFSEIKQLQRQQKLPISIARPSNLCSPLLENNRAKVRGTFSSAAESPSTVLEFRSITEASNQGMPRQLGHEPGIRQICNGETTNQYCAGRESTSVATFSDPNVDLKQAKRQSAQRSRVRKLQFIAELERTVNSLQNEILALSPQVMYLEQELVHLQVDNNNLKQQVTILLQDIKLKDAENQILEKDVQKLKTIHQLQQRQQQQKQKYEQPQEQHIGNQNEISLQSNFDFQLDQFSKLNLGLSVLPETRLLVSNDFSGVSKNAGEVFL